MFNKKNLLIGCTVVSLFASVGSHIAYAKDYPSQPIRLLVGFSAGGGTDTLARLYAKGLAEVLHAPVIVENKPGASQLLALQPLLSAKPDGYTLAIASGSALVQGPGVRSDLPYDPLKDFSLIAQLAVAPGIISVNPKLPIKSMQELIDYAKQNPGRLNYGSAGVGAANHLQTEYIDNLVKIQMTHIPYKSDLEVVTQVAGGDLSVGLTVAQAALPMATSGKIRPIAVTGRQRLSGLPDTPTLKEAGIEELESIDSYTMYGLVGPKNMPKEIVDKLNEAANKVSKMPEISKSMRVTLMFDPVTEPASAFTTYLQNEIPKWKALGQSINLKLK